jgi:methylisocitrate lyase
MLFQYKNPFEKRAEFRAQLKTGKLLRFPGAWSPLVAMQIEKTGFEGVYISGSVLSNDLGYPDVGLTTLSEVANRGRQIARATSLPSIIDVDTGFGVAMNAARSISELVEMGLAGCHLEDQENPKRCGHLDGKSLVSRDEMVMKIKAACEGKRMDNNFLIIARTDARASEGLDKAIDRAKAYIDAGAEMIFPEALANEQEFETFRKAVKVPLLANMTEFGKSKLLTTKQLENAGFNLVIYPVTTLRLAMKAVATGLQKIKEDGTQENIVPQMQTRKELYELTHYEDYNKFDQNIFNFKIQEN